MANYSLPPARRAPRPARGLLRLAALCSVFAAQPLLAQSGGGAGGAAAGAGTGAVGRGAAATAGAPAQNTSGQTTSRATPSQASQYAAGATLGPDPRKPPQSRPGALTLSQVLELARSKNPTLLAAEQNLRAVRAQEAQAAVRANPYLGLQGQNTTLGQYGHENPDLYLFQVSRLFERGQKRRFRIEDAKAISAQTEAQLNDTVRQTLLAVRQAFTRMLIAKEALELSSASLKDFQHEVDISRDRYKAGDLGRFDFERIDLQLGSTEAAESANIIALQQASDQLQTLIGIETPTQDFDVAGSILPPTLTQTQAALVQLALATRPDYAAARYAVDAAQANARLAQANGTTDPTLETEFERNGTDNSVGFSVSIPLRIFDKNQGNKDTARFQADATRFSLVAARNQVISDVDQAFIGYTQARRLSSRFGEHYLDESRDVLDIAQYAFEQGGLALVDYLDALREARQTSSDALNAYAQTWQALHQLSAATATELAP